MSNPIITSITPESGCAIAVNEISELPTLDVGGYTLGTQVFVRSANRPFVLRASTATVDHSAIEAVQGNTGLRWEVEQLKGRRGTTVAIPGLNTLSFDPATGDFFHVTGGGENLDLIGTAGWKDGAQITLLFEGSVTIRHGVTPTAGMFNINTITTASAEIDFGVAVLRKDDASAAWILISNQSG